MKTEGCFVKNKFFSCIELKFVDKVLNYLNNNRLFVISVSFFDSVKQENIWESLVETKKNSDQVAAGNHKGGWVVKYS